MKGQRRFLTLTRVVGNRSAGRLTHVWEELSIPIVSIKEIVPVDGKEQSVYEPWKDIQSKVVTKDGDIYCRETTKELLDRIERPYEATR